MHVNKNIYCEKNSTHCVKYIHILYTWSSILLSTLSNFHSIYSWLKYTKKNLLANFDQDQKGKNSFLDSIKRQTGYKTSQQDFFNANYSLSDFQILKFLFMF